MATDQISIYQPSPEIWTRRCASAGVNDSEALSRLVGVIYQGAMEAVPWQSALAMLREMLRAVHVGLLLRPPSPQSGGVAISADGFCAQAPHSHETHFFALDPFLRLRAGEWMTPEDIDPRWSEHALYREYLEPLDVGPILGANFCSDKGVECRLRITRACGAQAFSAQDRALCRFALPHFQRAVHLHARLDGLSCERQVLAGSMRRFALGMITLGRDGGVREINGEAARLLDARDGLAIEDGRIVGTGEVQDRVLRRLVDGVLIEAADDAPALIGSARLARSSGRPGLGIVARAVPASEIADGAPPPAAVLFLRDPESNGITAVHEAVRRRYGLTRTEADLALCLTDGCTIDDAAERLGLGRDAVRAHLRGIFSKTGVTRQAALVQMLLNGMLSLGGDVATAPSAAG